MSEQNDALFTEDDFARLGANDIAYVTTVRAGRKKFISCWSQATDANLALRRIIAPPLQLRSKTTSSRSAFTETQIVEA